MSAFLSSLSATRLQGTLWELNGPLIYYSSELRLRVTVPGGFVCDFESIPRIPIIYACLGHTSDRGGVIHDYLYRTDSTPLLSRAQADKVYREISLLVGNNPAQAYIKWLGVRAGGKWSYHKKSIDWKPNITV